jgi:hypothetical protein
VSWPQVVLVAIGSWQVIALAWIAAWQHQGRIARRAQTVEVVEAIKANGSH